jgi:hypothetical protein
MACFDLSHPQPFTILEVMLQLSRGAKSENLFWKMSTDQQIWQFANKPQAWLM